jgi:hypothetical protein
MGRHWYPLCKRFFKWVYPSYQNKDIDYNNVKSNRLRRDLRPMLSKMEPKVKYTLSLILKFYRLWIRFVWLFSASFRPPVPLTYKIYDTGTSQIIASFNLHTNFLPLKLSSCPEILNTKNCLRFKASKYVLGRKQRL